MADAGRILIIPRGDYDGNSTYEKLDLVKHKGTSWLAKKTATGVEPSEGEYWQKMFDINIADNLTTTDEGFVLDAKQGKILDEKIDSQVQMLDGKIATTNDNLTDLIKYVHCDIGKVTLAKNERRNYTIANYYTVPVGYKIVACTPFCGGGSSGDFCFSNVIISGTVNGMAIDMVTFANKSTTLDFTWDIGFSLLIMKR